MRITLDGLSFYGDEGDRMFTIDRESFGGWFEGPGVRRDDTPRPTGDGSFSAPTYRTGRSIGWSGLIRTSSPGEQRNALQQLAGVCSDRGLSRLTVQDQTEATWADVQLTSAPEATVLVYGHTARYSVELWAPDARRYGELRSFASGATVYHRGNAPAFPVVRIASAPAAYTITSPAGVFTVSGATSGGTHVIDMRTGRVTRNGVLMPGVSSGATWPIDPGTGMTVTVSGGSASIEVPDTFF